MPITTPKVPDGLPELMRGLAKSVIKENPENIYVHAAEYFENLIRERDGDLDKGYGSFSAYKVYSDYKDKCREQQGGSGAVPAKAVSDGDDDDSGGSASAAARGRRRKRVRKQGSKSVEKEDVPGSASSGGGDGGRENLSSIKEDALSTEKTVEEEPIRVETRKEVQTALSKAVSIDSEAAANAVSTVLEDTVLDSDEADREAAELGEPQEEAAEWENLKQPINCEDLSSYPAEEYGSAPSTAEVAGEVVGDGENGVQDGPPAEEVGENNSDEVDLTVGEKPEVDQPVVVNGSVEADVEATKAVSEEQPDPEEGIDTVDAENNEGITIGPRMDTGNEEDEAQGMPDVPTEDPGVEEGEPAQEESEAQVDPAVDESPESELKENVADEKPAEPVENGTECEEPKQENQESSTEKNPESSSPQKSVDQELSELAKQESQAEEPQPEENPKSDEGSLEKANSVEEPQPESNTKEPSLEKAEPEANNDGEQAPASQEANNGEEQPEKSASVDDNQKSEQNDAPATGSPQKSESIDAVEELTENPEAPASDENQKSVSDSPHKSASIEGTDEQVEGFENIHVTDQDQMSGKEEQPASSEEHQQSKQDVTPPPENEKSDSIDAAIESVGENAEVNQNSNHDEATAAESGSPKKSTSIDEQQDSAPQDEDQKSEQGEGANSPKKSASIDETEGQVSVPPDESSSPKKSASLEDQESPKSANQEPESEEPQPEENPKSGQGSQEKSGSIEDPPPEANSKESSLEKSESEPNASGEQSKESSAKESEADATASKQEASEEAGEVSIGSRMGAEDEDNGEEQQGEGSPEPTAPPSEAQGEDPDSNSEAKPESGGDKDETVGSEAKNDEAEGSQQNSVEEEKSKEEAVEEPCIQRQVSPSTSKPPSKNHSTDLEEIKKVDLASFNKDSAEALFYSLKQTELANEEAPKKEDGDQDEADDDADVVLGEEAAPATISRQLSKRSFTDDFLETGPITEEALKQAEGDGVVGEDQDDDKQFNPMMIATVRNQQLQDQLHSRDDTSLVSSTQRKTPIRRSMTERVDLVKQDSNYVDLRKYDPDYVQEEDDFDGYYIGNIKNKILASSVSVADSDDFDPRQSQELIDDNNVRTALETIASTDTESTLPSQITVQANRGFLKNTSSNIPYASFGNNAIDQSLDDFIEREEQNKEAEEQAAASKIQRSYRQFRSNKKKLLRDYHSTMQTCTEDQSTESLEECPNNPIIKIKVDQKQPEQQALQGEESESNSIEDGRAENRRRPMYSLNIDEYDTAARRSTLTRAVAMQRTSTPEEDSGKSENTSGENKKSSPLTASEPETKVAEDRTISTSGPSSTEDKKEGASSSDEKENKDTGSSKSNDDGGSKVEAKAKVRPLSDSSRKHTSLDAQKLFIARQRTMPVQIDASVIRVLPKHMRKRNKSAGMVRK